MRGTITAKKVGTSYFLMLGALAVLYILPQYGSVALMVGCASILSAHVAVSPEHFRSRSGSLFTACCLVASMWLGAAIVTVVTLWG